MKRQKHHKRLALNQETVKLLSERHAEIVIGGIITTSPQPSSPPGNCNGSPGLVC